MCSQEFGKSKYEQPGPIVEVDEESERAAMFERIRAYLEHGSPGPWSMTDGNLVIGADETPIARLEQPWTAFNCALVANSPAYIGFLLSEIDRLNGVHRASWDLHLGNQESLRSSLAEMQEKLDAGAEALGDWINRGVVPGAIGACIENLRESHDRFELKVAQLQQGFDRSIDERQKLLIANEELLAAKRERDSHAETIVQLTADLKRATVELDELRTTNAALGLMAVESLGKAAEADRELAAKSHSLTRLAQAEAARDRAIEERTTIGVRATELTAKNHALRKENELLKSVVWANDNALTAYQDFVTELFEARRLASLVPGLYGNDEEPAAPEVMIEAKFDPEAGRRFVREFAAANPIVSTSDQVPSL